MGLSSLRKPEKEHLLKGLRMGKAFACVAAWGRSTLATLVVGALRWWPGVQLRAQVIEAGERHFNLIFFPLSDSYSSDSAHLSSPL